MSRIQLTASSSTGFFQENPQVQSQYHEDASLKHAQALFLPAEIIASVQPELSAFSQRVLSPQVLHWLKDSEQNPPHLETWDTWGRRKDELITSNGWQQLQAMGIREGIVAIPYECRFKQYSRLYQFLKYQLWSASSGGVTCPSAMTDGAAALLQRHLAGKETQFPQSREEVIMRSAYQRLTSRDPEYAWTSGQWMTERPGGSDVRNTETHASLMPRDKQLEDGKEATDGSPLGPWAIDGFKWFSSAIDCDMTVLLAKTSNDGSSNQQISAFLAPTRYTLSSSSTNATSSNSITIKALNGIRPQRLKSKLGTRSLPTAELELSGMRGFLIGQKGQGVREIATILNITRIHNAVSAMGGWGRGLAAARAFARVRRVNNQRLVDVPAHARDLAHEHVKYRANMLFTYFVVALFGAVEYAARTTSPGSFHAFMGVENVTQATQLLRLLTSVLKATTAQAAITGLRYCMESMGGVGYLENDDPLLNIAKMFRDANVLAIWEGTTNVMAEDTVRVIQQKPRPGEADNAARVLCAWAERMAETWPSRSHGESFSQEAISISVAIDQLRNILKGASTQALLYQGPEVMQTVATVVTTVLLCEDAVRNPDVHTTREHAWRWLRTRGLPNPAKESAAEPQPCQGTRWTDLVHNDAAILAEYNADTTIKPML